MTSMNLTINVDDKLRFENPLVIKQSIEILISNHRDEFNKILEYQRIEVSQLRKELRDTEDCQ